MKWGKKFMKKGKGILYSALPVAIVAIIYSLLLFTFMKERTTNFWAAYGFTILALLIQIIGAGFMTGQSQKKQDVFSGLSIYVINAIYLGIQLIAGIILMLVPISLYYLLVIEIVLLALYVFFIILILGTKYKIDKQDNRVADKVTQVKLWETDIKLIGERMSDVSIKKELYKLKEMLRFSDPISPDALAPLEDEIDKNIRTLMIKQKSEEPITIGDVKKIMVLLDERNQKSKVLK